MIKRENYQICSQCNESIKSKGMPFKELLEAIIEVFALLNEPAAVPTNMYGITILEYLERNNYIISTEFPSPNGRGDIVLAIPLGCKRLEDDSCYFCFDTKNHE